MRGREGERERVYRSVGTDPVDYPLVVLINRNSASAAEIVAGAVQDHGRGLVVGETSFGKGLVQKVYPLPYGAGLTLTTAKYYTPYGRLIQRNYTSGSYYDYVTRHDEEEQAGRRPLPRAAPRAARRRRPRRSPAPQPTPAGRPSRPRAAASSTAAAASRPTTM